MNLHPFNLFYMLSNILDDDKYIIVLHFLKYLLIVPI